MDTFDEEIGRLEKSVIRLRVDLEEFNKSNKERAELQESNIAHTGKVIQQTRTDMLKKLSIEDKFQLQGQIDKLPQYEDFKDLYGKCLPAISSFEQKLIDMDVQVE